MEEQMELRTQIIMWFSNFFSQYLDKKVECVCVCVCVCLCVCEVLALLRHREQLPSVYSV